jgi:protein-tyrosine phosphatase
MEFEQKLNKVINWLETHPRKTIYITNGIRGFSISHWDIEIYRDAHNYENKFILEPPSEDIEHIELKHFPIWLGGALSKREQHLLMKFIEELEE